MYTIAISYSYSYMTELYHYYNILAYLTCQPALSDVPLIFFGYTLAGQTSVAVVKLIAYENLYGLQMFTNHWKLQGYKMALVPVDWSCWIDWSSGFDQCL